MTITEEPSFRNPTTVRRSNWSWPLGSRLATSRCLPIQMTHELGSLQCHQLRVELRKSKSLIQRLRIDSTLNLHTGCVNSLDWSEEGRYLLSGSDDLTLTLWDTYPRGAAAPFRFKTEHPNNIFSAKFLPCCENRELVSSSGDGMVIYSQLRESSVTQTTFKCHTGTTYRVFPLAGAPSCVMSCSEDGTVRLFDVRQSYSECDRKTCCSHSLLVNTEKAVSSLALNPARSFEFVMGCSDSTLTFYDRRKMYTALNRIRCQTTKNMPRRITSLQYDQYGTSLLANVLCEKIQLLDLHMGDQLRDGKAKKLEDPKELFPSEPLPIKRLRLRGDWSDTGPSVRPNQPRPAATSGSSRFMVEISDLMTTWMRNQMGGHSPSQEQGPRTPLVSTTDRSGDGGRNDSGIEDLLASAASRSHKPPENLIIVKPVLQFSGHRSSRTMIKEAYFWDDSYVISGSDCGRVFIWDRHSGDLVNVMEGDKHVVNCVASHPHEFILATSGIDHDVKIWRPTSPEVTFDAEAAQGIMEVNNQMLDETRDTVTVPALCVVRILRAMARRSQEGDQQRQGNSQPVGNAQARGDGSDSEEE